MPAAGCGGMTIASRSPSRTIGVACHGSSERSRCQTTIPATAVSGTVRATVWPLDVLWLRSSRPVTAVGPMLSCTRTGCVGPLSLCQTAEPRVKAKAMSQSVATRRRGGLSRRQPM